MDQPDSFDITHFSVRYPKAVMKHPFFVHNLVWVAHDDEFKGLCLDWTKDWVKTRVTFDTGLADEYFKGLSYTFDEFDNQFDGHPVRIEQRDGIRHDAVFQDAWQSQFPFVIYLEKFDCFRAWGYTELNSITLAAVQELEAMSRGTYRYSGRFADWSHFRRVVDTLDRFWD